MSIKTKLTVFIGLACGITMVALGISLFSLYRTSNEFGVFIDHNQSELAAYKEIYAQGLQMGQALRNILIDPSNEKAFKNFENAEKEFDNSIKIAESLSTTPDEKKLLADIRELRGKQTALTKEILANVNTNVYEAIALLRDKETPTWREMRGKTLEKIKVMTAETENIKNSVRGNAKFSIIFSSVLAALAIMMGPVIFVVMRNMINNMLIITSHITRLESETDVGTPLPDLGNDEIGLIAKSVNSFILKIKDTVRNIWECTSGTMVTSKKLNDLAAKSSEAVIRQNENIVHISAAMEEISATVKDVAGNAMDAATVISQASGVVMDGTEAGKAGVIALERINKTVTEASRTIRELDDSLDRIDEVANGIREITEQTNLLALSASIEAARAGEKGKGFAVVAEEVRTLSITTANFTADIVKIIKDVKASAVSAVEAMSQTQQEVENSTIHSKKLASALAEIEKAVLSASGAMENIAITTGQQSDAVDEVAKNLERIAQIASTNKVDMQQTSSSAESLVKASAEMRDIVSQFKFTYVMWSEEYATHIDKFDSQHRTIFTLINELHDAIASRHGKDALSSIFSRLVDYTASHFADEERDMASANYPRLYEHRQQHVDLTSKAISLQRQLAAGAETAGVETLSSETMVFLVDWLKNHIAKSDKDYGPYLNGKI